MHPTKATHFKIKSIMKNQPIKSAPSRLFTKRSVSLIILFILHFSQLSVEAQNLDSLYAVWKDPSQTDSLRTAAFKDFIYKGFLDSNPDTAAILADELIAFGKKQHYPRAQGLGFKTKGNSFLVQGNYPKALANYTQSLKIFEQLGDKQGIADVLYNIGTIYNNQGDYPKALDYYAQSSKIYEQLGDQKGIADALNIIGLIYYKQGDYPKALDYYTQSSKIYEQVGDKDGIATGLNNIGNTYSDLGDHLKALDYYKQSLKIYEKLGYQDGIASSLNNIGNIYSDQGDYPKALDYYSQGLAIYEKLGYPLGMAGSLNNVGNIYSYLGDHLKALDYYTQSLKIYEQLGDQDGIARLLGNVGNIYYHQDDYPKALDYCNQSLKIYEQLGNQPQIAHILNNMGVIYTSQGDYPKALDYCQKGYDMALSIRALLEQKNACACLYDTYKAMGKGNKALVYMEKINLINDSLHAEETAKKLQQMEFEKVMLQDSIAKAEEARMVQEAHEEEMRQEEKTRNIAFGVGAILLLLAFGLYTRVRYIRKSKAVLQVEKDRSENLLLNILPEEIAQELKIYGKAEARDFDMVSILFTDFKGFTEQSAKLSAAELVQEINHCFEAFDGIIDKYNIEKIKTIGDAYMAAGGLPVPTDHSVKNTVRAALEMQAFICKRKADMDAAGKPAFEMRVGIHTGPVVAGIVGVKKFQYDIWGDTVNTASRIESNGEAGKVNISQATYELLKNDPDFAFESRGKIEAKGKGEMEMYFVSLKN
jgi:class 3 adenylate cyclase/Tfp pilus assembly protein PilF